MVGLKTTLAAFAVGAIIGLASGWSMHADREAARQLKTAQASSQRTAEGKDKGDALATTQAKAAASQATKDRVITKEVIRYVEVTPAADRCTLPGTWRMRHDASATGEPAEPTRLAHGATDPVDDAAALETVADNYAGCRHVIEQVKGWQDWWQIAKHYCGAEHGRP